MPEFSFKGRNKQGAMVEGQRTAASAEMIAAQLFSEGIIPIFITQTKLTSSVTKIFSKDFMPKKITADDMMMFCRQMSTLYKAGIPITVAIKLLADTTTNKTLSSALTGVARTLESGENLANSMQSYPKIFPPLITKLMRIGEDSAKLDEAFTQAGDYLELETKTLKHFKAVLRYPIFVFIAISVAITIMNIVVIPAFARIFARFHTELPLPTRILLGTSNFMIHYWPYLLGGLIVGFFSLRHYLRTPNGKLRWDRIQLKLPIVGSIITFIVLARFTKTFSIIVRSGMPLAEGIELSAAATNNAYAHQRIGTMKQAVEHGETLTAAAASAKIFTPLVLQMLTVGEETGNLDTLLKDVSVFYEQEIEYNMKRLADRMEPILLIGIAIMVLVLALGVFLPMWDMVNFVK